MLQSLNSASTLMQVPAANSAGSQIPALDSQAFLKLLTTQLQHQDPLSPTDPGDTVQQLAALTQVSTLQEISSLLRQFLGKGSSYDPASWLGRSALVTSSYALPQADGSYAGELSVHASTPLDIVFSDANGVVVHTEHHDMVTQGTIPFSWDGKLDGMAVEGQLNISVNTQSGPAVDVAVWTTVTSIRHPAIAEAVVETPLGGFLQTSVIDLK